MLTKNQIKYIKSLHNKKDRNENNTFLVEGKKSLIELLNSNFELEILIISQEFYDENKKNIWNRKIEILSPNEITKLSSLQTNSDWIAVVKQKQNTQLENNWNEIILVLDDIKDPWNLWTIMRIADWYWVTKIIASKDTCEFYNTKVIISTMWSFTRVNLFYTDLKEYLQNQSLPIYGSFINWENIHQTKLEKSWVFIIIWNESNGISQKLEKFITKKISIPKFWLAESLNAWVATGIILDNFQDKSQPKQNCFGWKN